MEGKERREQIIKLLSTQGEAISGTKLAKMTGVSRQVIVQDIALLRAVNKNILSTTKGYIWFCPNEKKVNRTFLVSHNQEQIRDELNTIVDCGGRVLDVIVDHEIYGPITVDLILGSRKEVDDFVKRVENAMPLMRLTNGEHYHTVEADREDILNHIEEQLLKKGYLLNR